MLFRSKDVYTAEVAAGVEIGERVQKYIDSGVAEVAEHDDGSKTITCHHRLTASILQRFSLR